MKTAFYLIVISLAFLAACAPSQKLGKVWKTKGDKSVLLQPQTDLLFEKITENTLIPTLEIYPKQDFQTIDGFGFTLTGGSAAVLQAMTEEAKTAILEELFSPEGIAISYLRLSIGASDLSAYPFSYNDLPQGATDLELTHFNLSADTQAVVPILKRIVALNPAIKIIATPWSPPVWLKDNGSFIGGSLKPEYYAVYAQYFVKYIQAMAAEGITIEAITPQNEPLHPHNNPSMLMTAEQQRDFIPHLADAFQRADISTKIIIYDHNCDRPDYPLLILDDPAVKPLVWGTAFHLYAGDIATLSQIHNAHPDKHLFFTEQYTASNGDFEGDLHWHFKNVLIGALQNWSRAVLEWNLANDANFRPHTEGGCTTCKGALTIEGDAVNRNVAYYIIAHAAKFVPSGSVRIGSSDLEGLENVAFRRADGKIVLIVQNETDKNKTFIIKIKDEATTFSLDAKAVATLVF